MHLFFNVLKQAVIAVNHSETHSSCTCTCTPLLSAVGLLKNVTHYSITVLIFFMFTKMYVYLVTTFL